MCAFYFRQYVEMLIMIPQIVLDYVMENRKHRLLMAMFLSERYRSPCAVSTSASARGARAGAAARQICSRDPTTLPKEARARDSQLPSHSEDIAVIAYLSIYLSPRRTHQVLLRRACTANCMHHSPRFVRSIFLRNISISSIGYGASRV